MSAVIATNTLGRKRAQALYDRICDAEKEFGDHMSELNVSPTYTPESAVSAVNDQLTTALANLQVAVECVKAARAEVRRWKPLTVHPYFETQE